MTKPVHQSTSAFSHKTMPITRSQSKKFDAAKLPAVGQSTMQATREPMIEWLVFDYLETATAKRVNWKDLLNEVQAVEGCRYINFACPAETPQKLWIIIRKALVRATSKEADKKLNQQSGCLVRTETIFTEQTQLPGRQRTFSINKMKIFTLFIKSTIFLEG